MKAARGLRPQSFIPWALFLSVLFGAQVAQAQSGVEVENVGATVRFEEQITFVASFQSSVPIQHATITILDESQGLRQTEPLTVQPDGTSQFQWNISQLDIRPFSEIKWSYQIVFADGTSTSTEFFSVRYVDNRFDWQTLEAETLRVHWYNGEPDFGEAMLNTGRAGLQSVSRLVAVDLTQPVEIYAYASPNDLRATLERDASVWIAGHTDPALGVIMVAIEPGAEQAFVMEQRLPHELMHIMMSRAVGAGYQNIPAWLREGTATLAELHPNSEYERVLAEAAADHGLIPLHDLCTAFPADTAGAFLAYAESQSFARYLHQTYGSAGILKLARTYADGADCERGTELALAVTFPMLEARWQAAALGQNSLLPALQNMTPYLVLLCFVLIFPFVGFVSSALRKKGNRNGPETFV